MAASRIEVLAHSARAGVLPDLRPAIADFISAAETELAIAAYDLRSDRVLRALHTVANRGVAVRIVVDTVAASVGHPAPDGTIVTELDLLNEFDVVTAPAPAAAQEHRPIMHSKYLVRDRSSVLTGSANFSEGGLTLQDNDCLVVHDPQIAAAYQSDFEHVRACRLADIGSSGAGTQTDDVHVLFAPGPDVRDALCAVLRDAGKVRFALFEVSDVKVLGVLADLHRQGVDISGVYDPNGMDEARSVISALPELFWWLQSADFAPAPSAPFSPSGERNFLHNKLFIVDDATVITGSYNYSRQARRNAENALIITSEPVAAAYSRYWSALFDTYGGHG